MLTGRTDRHTYARAIEAGCAGFVHKTESPDKLLAAIHAAFEGDSLPAVSGLRQILSRLPETRRGVGGDLSARELEVLQRLADGLPNKLIARRLEISVNTVGNHVRNILYKLDAHSRLEAVAVAVREGVIPRETGAADG
jgi:DNA-binding NarL/FixJ family response regulator